nr:MAG TPA: hypothetical protein [Caudoviricetes sp.]
MSPPLFLLIYKINIIISCFKISHYSIFKDQFY